MLKRNVLDGSSRSALEGWGNRAEAPTGDRVLGGVPLRDRNGRTTTAELIDRAPEQKMQWMKMPKHSSTRINPFRHFVRPKCKQSAGSLLRMKGSTPRECMEQLAIVCKQSSKCRLPNNSDEGVAGRSRSDSKLRIRFRKRMLYPSPNANNPSANEPDVHSKLGFKTRGC